jgi:hypothetical protein
MAVDKQRRAFISYSRTNKEFATKLAKGLRSAGYPVWFDLFDIPTGARWDDEVEKALRECSIFMIILTPASIASENVKDEIGYAIDHGKRILPILLEQCDVPLRLRRFQYVDFTTKSFEEGFESAKELLRDLVEASSVPVAGKIPLVDAPIESKPEPVKTKSVATEPAQKRPIPIGLVIGVIAFSVFVVAWIGYKAISNGRTPATETPVAASTATRTSVATNTATEAPSVSQEKTIVGQWVRRSSEITEYFNFEADGSFHIEGRNNDSNSVVASADGSYTYDENNVYYDNPDFTVKFESYYLDNGGDLLVIGNQVDKAWTRIK